MLSWPPTVKIFLGAEPTDMRKGFDSLAHVVESSMALDPLSGHLFVFRSRRGDRIKVLYWDADGYVLWYKKQASDCTRPRPFTGNLGHTNNLAGRPVTAGGVGSNLQSSRPRRRSMSRSGSALVPPRAHRASGRRRAIVSGIC
jgi:IS66 Orf2 like protein